VQWHGAAVAETVALTGGKSPKRGLVLVLAAVAVLAAHALGVWYGNSVSVATGSPPKKSTLALEIIRPPKPLPKIEPPPPPPAKPRIKAPPPIQAATVAPSDAPVAAPVETVAALAPAEPAPPPAPEPVKPAFGGIGYKNNPPPDYPTIAVRQGWQGTVLLRVRVLQSGTVESVEVVRSSGKKVLDDAAIHTVERWMFAPSTRGNSPIDGFATVPIEFKLDS
jgi:protein TonB